MVDRSETKTTTTVLSSSWLAVEEGGPVCSAASGSAINQGGRGRPVHGNDDDGGTYSFLQGTRASPRCPSEQQF